MLMRLNLSKQHIGILLVIFSSVCFAFVPNSGKIALDAGSSLFFLIVSRYAIGIVLLLPLILLTRSGETRSGLKIQRHQLRPLIITSLMALGLLLATYHAIDYLDIGLVLLILYSFPIGVALIAQSQGRERFSRNRWLCMVAVIMGLGLMIYDGGGEISTYGVFISIIGLVCFVLFIDTSSGLAVSIGGAVLNFYISLIGLVTLMLAFMLPLGLEMALPQTTPGVISIFSNGVFFILSWVLFFEGARLIGATRASLLACVEPLFAALLAMLLLNQMLSAVEWIGFFIVLTAIWLFERLALPAAPAADTPSQPQKQSRQHTP